MGCSPFFFIASKKMASPIDVAVVGHRCRGLADFHKMFGEFVDVASAIQKRVVRVQVKMSKFCRHDPSLQLGNEGQIGREKGFTFQSNP